MTTTYHTDIVAGAALNVASVNGPLGTLDAQLVALTATAASLAGGATVTHARLLEWAAAEAYQIVENPIVYDATYPDLLSDNATNTVTWPDGSAGELTVTAYDTTWVAIKSYTITHVDSTHTVTQPAITRDATTGNVTIKPALTVTTTP